LHILGPTFVAKNIIFPTKDLYLSVSSASLSFLFKTELGAPGELHTVGGCLTAFSSKGEKSISNSTAEAEYKSLSNGGREAKFQQMLLEEIAYIFASLFLFQQLLSL